MELLKWDARHSLQTSHNFFFVIFGRKGLPERSELLRYICYSIRDTIDEGFEYNSEYNRQVLACHSISCHKSKKHLETIQRKQESDWRENKKLKSVLLVLPEITNEMFSLINSILLKRKQLNFTVVATSSSYYFSSKIKKIVDCLFWFQPPKSKLAHLNRSFSSQANKPNMLFQLSKLITKQTCLVFKPPRETFEWFQPHASSDYIFFKFTSQRTKTIVKKRCWVRVLLEARCIRPVCHQNKTFTLLPTLSSQPETPGIRSLMIFIQKNPGLFDRLARNLLAFIP